MGNLFQELKRRKVFRVAAIYAIVAWLLIQVVDVVLPTFNSPQWVIQTIIFVLMIGLPVAVVLAWAFDVTPEGIQKTEAAGPGEPTILRKRDYFFSTLVVVLVSVVVVQQFVIFNRLGGGDPLTALDGMSIAVLPLENLSPEPDNAYFAAGVHEEILNLLQKIPGIRVISRRAVLVYQDTTLSLGEIAQELGVRYLMTGSVRFAGNQVRINLQLTQAHDNTNLWSEPYERELDDIFAIQSDVALQVANALEATLSPNEIASIERPATVSTEAYTLFSQHRYQMEQESLRPTLDEDGWIESGIRKMERAVELDPSFAEGFAELGFLKRFKGSISPLLEQNDLFDEALDNANRANEIDPTVARAYTGLSRVYFARRQWEEWLSHARQSVELPDLDGSAALNFGLTLTWIGQYEEAWSWHDVAISKDPSSVSNRGVAIIARISGRDYETALTMAEQFSAVGGDENAYHLYRAYALNRLDRQVESSDDLGEISSVPIEAIRKFHDYLRCQSGEEGSVMEELEKLDIEQTKEERIQYCAAGAGNLEETFKSFRRTMDREQNIYYGDIVSDEIRADPRWQEVEGYMNLPDLTNIPLPN